MSAVRALIERRLADVTSAIQATHRESLHLARELSDSHKRFYALIEEQRELHEALRAFPLDLEEEN